MGIVLGAVVFSFWILDLLVHRADLPILPAEVGDLPRLGFGLWQYPLVSALLEAALVIVGSCLYRRAANSEERAAGGSENRASMLAELILTAGLVTLALDLVAAWGT